jgi:hypothetical protein
MTSPSPAERAALKVAEAAAQSPSSAYGLPSTIVFALGAAGLLMGPETAADIDRSTRERVSTDLVLWADRMEAARPDFADVRRDAYYVRRAARVAVSGVHLYTSVRPEAEHAFLSEVERLRSRVAELESLVLAAGAAAEQRHQLYDPSEPPLACLVTGDICAVVIAEALAAHPEPCRFPSGPDCTCVPQAVTA